MTVSRLLKSCAMPPDNCPTASIFCACDQLLLGLLALGEVVDDAGEDRPPSCLASLTARSIGKVVPSLRRPVTSRPMPMIFFCAGAVVVVEVAVVLAAGRARASAS